MISALYLATTYALALPASVNFNTNSEMPPGGQIIQTLINWAMFVLGAAGVIGFIIGGILLASAPANSHQHGVGGKLLKVGLGVVIGSVSVLLVNALM